MHSTHLFLLIAIIGTLALAAPTRHSHNGPAKHTFRVHHKGRPKPSAQEALAHAYRKHGWHFKWDSDSTRKPTRKAKGSHNSTTGGSNQGEVTATPEQNDSAYVAPVNIGGQVLHLDFDTGSSDLWVFSTEVAQGAGSGHTLFNPAQSSSFVEYPGATWSTQYGDGSSASGNVGFDSVTIGGVTAQKQCVELAQQTKGFGSLKASDGLLGLAFSTLNQVKPQQQQTFWENIQDQLEQPLFTADLDETATGSYEFGSIDSSKFTGEIHYTPVDNTQGYWMLESKSFSINGQTQQCSNCSPLIADTGTSLLLVDQDVVEAYYNQVQSAQYDSQQGLFAYSCDETLPDFGLAIGSDYTAVLKGSLLNFAETGNGQCVGGIQWNGNSGFSIAGDVFLKQYFAVFDGGNLQFGVAPKAIA